jgi:glyoxylase-like metal-dependent hydrolase (beta-lactamase superfamily II)
MAEMTQPQSRRRHIDPPRSITVGDIRLTYLPDGECRFITGLFPDSTEESWRRHRDLLDDDGRWTTSLGGFLVETGDRKVLVDLAWGDVEFEAPGFAQAWGGRFLDSLKQTGVSPEAVDTVVYTHFHSDHVGWTMSGGGFTFPNARHVAGSGELGFWLVADPVTTPFAPDPDAVRAPLESRLEEVCDGESVAPGITVRATPGHTPGHISLVVSSGSDRAIILGDIVHCVAQIAEPEWEFMCDVDRVLARQTRDELMAELEGSDTTVACSHLSRSYFGRVLPAAGKRYWGPIG